MKLKIREATLNDLDVLLNFEQQLINVERPMDSSLEQKKRINYFDIPEFITSDTAELYVAIVDNEIIGCGYGLINQNKSKFTQKKHGYIGFIFVKEEYRGKGVNKYIFEAIFDWFKTRGIIEVRLSVYEQNLRAIKAYQKLGFETNLVQMLYNPG